MINEKNIYRETWQGTTPGYNDGNPIYFPASQTCEKSRQADLFEQACLECERRFIEANNKHQAMRMKKATDSIRKDIARVKSRTDLPKERREKMLEYLNKELKKNRRYPFKTGAEVKIAEAVGREFGISAESLKKIWQPRYITNSERER